MPTKAEKKKHEQFLADRKRGEEMLSNPTPEVISKLEDYVAWQILYINDCAANAVLFLGPELQKVHYNGNGAKILYGAAAKRARAYLDMVTSMDFDIDYLVEMCSQMDEYMDNPTSKLRHEIKVVLDANGVENSQWIASVETARLLCNYAVEIAKQYVNRIAKFSTKCQALRHFNVSDMSRVMESLSDFVCQTSNIRNKCIDLNKEENVMSAFRRFVKAFNNAENFKTASDNTNAMF